MKWDLKRTATTTLPVIAALVIGWWVGFWMADAPPMPATMAASTESTIDPHAGHDHGGSPMADAPETESVSYTCSMHPQVRSDTPGQCPLCGMDLVAATRSGGAAGRVSLSEGARILAGIETVEVGRQPVARTLRLVGEVAAADTGIDAVTAWFRGRIERLYADVVGAEVKKGDKLYSIYSPDLLAAQRELLETDAQRVRLASNPTSPVASATTRAFEAARERLRLWGMASWQIARVLKLKRPAKEITIYAAHDGTVTSVAAREGSWVSEGSPVVTLTDLSRVWVEFEAYERDLAWLALGQEIQFTTPSRPGQPFLGEVTFISPTIAAKTRTATVRIVASDPDKALRPGSYVAGVARVALDVDGGPDPLVIPDTAPLISGDRAIVFVEMEGEAEPTYLLREVTLGRRGEGVWVVKDGLMSGERVVRSGAFKLDSDLQISGAPSLMNAMKEPKADPPKDTSEGPPLSKPARAALLSAVEQAMTLSDAMASDDAVGTEREAPRLVDRLEGLADRVSDPPLAASLREAAAAMRTASGALSPTRTAYVAVNKALHPLVERHKGLLDAAYQVTFCPMANDDNGAYWIQRPGEIRNPYFGAEMLTCGAATHTVKEASP